MTRVLVPKVNGLCYGADYNPEQWPEDVWARGRRADAGGRGHLVTVGVFSWALLEPAPGPVRLRLAGRGPGPADDGGIAVDLATATASPPPWLSHRAPGDPAGGPRTAAGLPRRRQALPQLAGLPRARRWRWSAAGRPVRATTRRWRMWHVHNEYGCHNMHCYCDDSAPRPSATGCATATATSTRSTTRGARRSGRQRYSDWAQVLPPRATPTFANPTQQLDFRRFCSDALLACSGPSGTCCDELTPGVPVTTNFMGMCDRAHRLRRLGRRDGRRLQRPLPVRRGPGSAPAELAFAADLIRGSPAAAVAADGALHQRGQLAAAQRGEAARASWSATACCARGPRRRRGAVLPVAGQSRAGAEKWHSAMVPHAGTDSDVWRDVVALGGHLAALAPVRGLRVRRRRSAILHDYESSWAASRHPAQRRASTWPEAEVRRWHAALLAAGRHRRPRPPGAPTRPATGLVLVPGLYLVSDADAANLAGYVAERRHRCWSARTAASSTSTTRCGSAATRAPSATCSASGSRSTSRCWPASRSAWTTAAAARCGPNGAARPAPRCWPGTPTARWRERPR